MEQDRRHLLIIGAGYVGAELARQARKAGWSTTSVTKTSSTQDTYTADVTVLPQLETLKTQIAPVDCIVHCASSGRGGAEAYKNVFYHGVLNLQATFPKPPLLFVSSTSVYAQTHGETVTETSTTSPDRETGKILLETEHLVTEAGGNVARLAGIYGPARSVLLKKLLRGDARIEEDGRRIINQIHRDDAASALLFLADQTLSTLHNGEVYNVADSTPRSQKATYEGLCHQLHLDLPPVTERDMNRKRGWTHKAVSNQKLRSLGWAPKHADFLQASAEIVETL